MAAVAPVRIGIACRISPATLGCTETAGRRRSFCLDRLGQLGRLGRLGQMAMRRRHTAHAMGWLVSRDGPCRSNVFRCQKSDSLRQLLTVLTLQDAARKPRAQKPLCMRLETPMDSRGSRTDSRPGLEQWRRGAAIQRSLRRLARVSAALSVPPSRHEPMTPAIRSAGTSELKPVTGFHFSCLGWLPETCGIDGTLIRIQRYSRTGSAVHENITHRTDG